VCGHNLHFLKAKHFTEKQGEIMMKERVVVAMSGGVDSSVAAALLQDQGYEVIGITMCFSLPDSVTKKPRCCGLQGIEDARRVAHKLGIKHYVLNMQRVLEERVIKNFCLEYLRGRTPNPCVLCNQYVKFGALLKKAISLGAMYLATGHYVRVSQDDSGYQLKKAVDTNKDQSYFLYRLGQKQLKHLLFPLGDLTKPQVRQLARQFGLITAEKSESQEICFIPDENYHRFVVDRITGKAKGRLDRRLQAGEIVDTKGKVLGKHRGIVFYTIGQRQGLGLACGYPVYILKIDAKSNRIVVGSKEEAMSAVLLIKTAHFVSKPFKKKVELNVKIRYNHKESVAQVSPEGKGLKIRFKTPQFAITCGQSAVMYDGDTVVGGGIIDKVWSKDND